jgi:ubiquinone/menaquinone biosynthesis C-methylase UbiE
MNLPLPPTRSQVEPDAYHLVAGDSNYVASDGLPIPPLDLIFLVIGTREPIGFIEGGRTIAHQSIVTALAKHGLDLNGFHAILDFGCGCGRLMRHWRYLTKPRLYGADYNPALVEWCRDHLTFAQFQVNQLEPPLSFPDEQFDFVFCGSVFTHFTETLQFAWLRELQRVSMPGASVMITTHGEHYARQLPPDLQGQFRAGMHVVVHQESAGQNACGAYHSEQYIRNTLAAHFDIVDVIAKGWDTQDIVVLRKKP